MRHALADSSTAERRWTCATAPAVLPVGVGGGAGNEASERTLEQVDVRVIGEQVDGPQHGNLPQLDHASVEGPEQRHHRIHVEVSGQSDAGYQQHRAPHGRRERLQWAVSAEAEEDSAKSGTDQGGSDQPEQMLILALGALPDLVGGGARDESDDAEKAMPRGAFSTVPGSRTASAANRMRAVDRTSRVRRS